MIWYCEKFDCEISDREVFICMGEDWCIPNNKIPCPSCEYFVKIDTKEKRKWWQNLKRLKENA